MEKLFLVMPAYNEEDNIKAVIDEWYPILAKGGDGSRLVVADSGSTDNTHEILVELQQEYDSLQILSDTRKQHGPKLMALYDYAVRSGADYIFQTDSERWKMADFCGACSMYPAETLFRREGAGCQCPVPAYESGGHEKVFIQAAHGL